MGARVGVLGIQGDIEAHADVLRELGAEPCRVLAASELFSLDALVLPGGESTTISKGLDRLALWDGLRDFVSSGRPVLGTCAGAILLARHVENRPVGTLGLVDIRAQRNAYGTQVDSFAATADPGAAEGLEGFRCIFIRAPRLSDPGPAVDVLVRVDSAPVLVRQGRVLACAFHPELSGDPRVHGLLFGP